MRRTLIVRRTLIASLALAVAVVVAPPGPASAAPPALRRIGERLASVRSRAIGVLESGRDRLQGLACTIPGNLGRSAARAGESVVYVSSRTGTGSGFVYRSSGRGGQLLIATNHHVVSDVGLNGRVTVTLSDGQTVPARVQGYSSLGDLAVLEPLAKLAVRPLELRGCPVRQEQVAAIGHPYGGLKDGVQPWITQGLVTQARPRYSFVFDAALAEGSSGGPVVDRRGRVVGVTVGGVPGRRVASGSFFGIGIPAAVVRTLLPAVESSGEVVRLTILRDGKRQVVTTSAAPLESLEGRPWLTRRGKKIGAQLTLPGVGKPADHGSR